MVGASILHGTILSKCSARCIEKGLDHCNCSLEEVAKKPTTLVTFVRLKFVQGI